MEEGRADEGLCGSQSLDLVQVFRKNKKDEHRSSNMSKLDRLFFVVTAFPPAAPSSQGQKKLDQTSNIARPNADGHISATEKDHRMGFWMVDIMTRKILKKN